MEILGLPSNPGWTERDNIFLLTINSGGKYLTHVPWEYLLGDFKEGELEIHVEGRYHRKSSYLRLREKISDFKFEQGTMDYFSLGRTSSLDFDCPQCPQCQGKVLCFACFKGTFLPAWKQVEEKFVSVLKAQYPHFRPIFVFSGRKGWHLWLYTKPGTAFLDEEALRLLFLKNCPQVNIDLAASLDSKTHLFRCPFSPNGKGICLPLKDLKEVLKNPRSEYDLISHLYLTEKQLITFKKILPERLDLFLKGTVK